ncbi:putative helix-turn-helix family protein (plasmid) [Clostridium botulinum C/D str. BKT12695]|nr:putative helix-turn-helix family protein [Clostridium botulinum C/D str. BKT12695]
MNLKLKEILEQKGKSVYWLKNQTNISHSTIYKMVNNETKMISFENLHKICKALKCTPNDVFVFNDIEKEINIKNESSNL